MDEIKEKLVERIQKVLRLADKKKNSSIGEVETAMRVARYLLKKHGLSMADVMTEDEANEDSSSIEIQEVTGATFKCTKVPKWMTILISVVNKLTDTKTVVQNFVPFGKGYGSIKIIFIGISEDVVVANELFHYLRNSVTKLSTHYQNQSKGKFRQWRSFAEGCVCKLMQRTLEIDSKRTWKPGESQFTPLDVDNFECDPEEDELSQLDIDNYLEDDEEDVKEEFSEETHKKYALVVAGKYKAIDDHIKRMKAVEENLSTSANLDHKSFSCGSIAGETISLHTHKLVKEENEKSKKRKST